MKEIINLHEAEMELKMELKLSKPVPELEKAYMEYISEWESSTEKIVPFAARREGADFASLLERWAYEETEAVYEKGFVPATLYFLVDENRNINGAVHIRHELNDHLLKSGGHIGYGIKPSARGRKYAIKMLSLALPKAKELGIEKVLITCDKVNTASARTILNNGGILENEILEDKEIVQRYWITSSLL